MTVNGVQGFTKANSGERRVKEFEHGQLKTLKVFKDVNGDGKEDLYSVTTFPQCFCSDTHDVTTYDDDGDGLADRIIKRDFSNLNGKRQIKNEQEIKLDQEQKFKMSDIGKSNKRNLDIKW